MILTTRQTLILAILVLFLGKYLTKKVKFLKEYNIPEPVSGGVLASLVVGIFYLLTHIEIDFTLVSRDHLLIIFFTTIGLSSRLSTLVKGGKPLAILLVLAVVYLFLQNLTGIGIALATGLNPAIGMIGGSISLSGGHGTTIAWAPNLVENFGVSNAMEVGIACATFGLVLGGLIGGPLAKFLVTRFNLHGTKETLVVGKSHEEEDKKIDYESMLRTILVIAVAVGLGIHLNKFLHSVGLKLPDFVTCLFGGIVLTNTVPLVMKNFKWPTGTPSLALFSDLSLGLFLSMSLMSLKLWTLIDLAGPILLLLGTQLIVICLFAYFVIFRVMGRNYDAAVMSAGYVGLGLGATPTAIANMTAVTQKYGASAQAFIVVPLVGAFFIDIAHAFIIQFILNFPIFH